MVRKPANEEILIQVGKIRTIFKLKIDGRKTPKRSKNSYMHLSLKKLQYIIIVEFYITYPTMNLMICQILEFLDPIFK